MYIDVYLHQFAGLYPCFVAVDGQAGRAGHASLPHQTQVNNSTAQHQHYVSYVSAYKVNFFSKPSQRREEGCFFCGAIASTLSLLQVLHLFFNGCDVRNLAGRFARAANVCVPDISQNPLNAPPSSTFVDLYMDSKLYVLHYFISSFVSRHNLTSSKTCTCEAGFRIKRIKEKC